MNAEAAQAIPPITLLRQNVRVAGLVAQIEAHPELWGQNIFRTRAYPGNPHGQLQDIIVRYNDWSRWTGDRAAFNAIHESMWWAPYESLPAIRPLVFDLMRLYEAEQLGMVLITRIPPHTTCERHRDGGWHAQYYTKLAVSLKASPQQKFCFDEAELVTDVGDLWAFDNAREHWVVNDSDEDRWTLIICLRMRQPTCHNCVWKGE